MEEAIYVEGKLEMKVPMEVMLAALERRFQSVEGNPRIGMIKRAAQRHIRKHYE